MDTDEIGLRIKIIPTLKESCILVYKNSLTVLAFCWLPFILFSIFALFDTYSFTKNNVPTVDNAFLSLIPFHLPAFFNPKPYIYLIVEGLITIPFILALYRFFITDQKDYNIWTYKRGIETPTTVFRLFWYFKFQKRELIVFGLFTLLSLIFLILKDVNLWIRIEKETNIASKLITEPYLWSKIGLELFEDLTFAALILIWPTIAIAEHFKVSQIPSFVKAVKGNIIRIYIISSIIYIPILAFDYSTNFLPYITEHLDEIYRNIIFDAHYAFGNIMYFGYICINVAFISLVYKELKNRKKI